MERMGTLLSTAAIPLSFNLHLFYLSLLCPEALKALGKKKGPLGLQRRTVEMMVSLSVQNLSENVFLGLENELVKCSAAQLKRTRERNISAGHSQNLEKPLLEDSVQ